MYKPVDLDVTVPVMVLKLTRNVAQHSTVCIIRSLGILGVPVYARVEDRFAPAAMSRYLTGAFVWKILSFDPEPLLTRLATIGEQLGRPTILVPIDDLSAVLVAENSHSLEKWFLFPRLPKELPRRLMNKKELYFLCRSMGVPCPEAAFPGSLDDVYEFIERAKFPVVVKTAVSQWLPKGTRSVTITQTPQELIAIYRQAESQKNAGLILQEYIPESCAEDWVFHGYSNLQSDCLVAFTGRKLRSYPPFTGFTTLGVSVPNETVSLQAEKLLKAIAYSGIMDIDYRLDKRDGQYKLLDFNPRIGANFRMFENRAGIDTVRALHLDLTGRLVRRLSMVVGRTFVVEPYDLFATLGYMRQGRLTVRQWRQSLAGNRETAWFNRHDPLPFLLVCARLLLRAVRDSVQRGWRRIRDLATTKERSHGLVACKLCSRSSLPANSHPCETMRHRPQGRALR
jgi:D-aspartate ligase